MKGTRSDHGLEDGACDNPHRRDSCGSAARVLLLERGAQREAGASGVRSAAFVLCVLSVRVIRVGLWIVSIILDCMMDPTCVFVSDDSSPPADKSSTDRRQCIRRTTGFTQVSLKRSLLSACTTSSDDRAFA